MYHRYGRHGSEAWIRHRKHRFAHLTRSLVPAVSVTVIHIHFQFANQERIIIVAFDQNGTRIDDMYPVVSGEAITRDLVPAQSEETPAWKIHAQSEALVKYGKDRTRFKAAEPPTKEEIRDYAEEKFYENLTQFALKTSTPKETSQLLKDYAQAFLDTYEEHLSYAQEVIGTLPDDVTMRVRRKARDDKTRHRTASQDWSLRKLDFLAAIRALELLSPDDIPEVLKRPESFSRIEELASAYIHEYNDNKEVRRDRPDFSNGFRG